MEAPFSAPYCDKLREPSWGLSSRAISRFGITGDDESRGALGRLRRVASGLNGNRAESQDCFVAVFLAMKIWVQDLRSSGETGRFAKSTCSDVPPSVD